VKKLIILITFSVISTFAKAQCAMCRATIENSISKGHTEFAATLNTGIMYLFITPYVLAGIVALFWFRTSKKNAQKNNVRIRAERHG